MTEQEHAAAIALAAGGLTTARKQLDDMVAAARAAGITWRVIGDALDVSRQAAQERFAHVQHRSTTQPTPGEVMTDHHVAENADDHRRPSIDQPGIRGRHPGTSALAGVEAGRDIYEGDRLVDLVGPEPSIILDDGPIDTRTKVVRRAGAPIPAGSTLEVRADGQVYPVDETATDLAEQLVDVAAAPQVWVTTTPTIFGVEVQLDDTIPKDELHLRDPHTGKTEVRIINIHEPTPEEGQRSLVGVLERDLEPWTSTETATQTDTEDQP